MTGKELSQRAKNLSLFFSLVALMLLLLILNILFAAGKASWFTESTTLIAKNFGASDQGAYLRVALDLHDLVLEPENYWIVQLWPPGTPVISSLLDLLPGPLLIYLVSVVAVCWTIPAYLMIISSNRSTIVFALVLILWIFNPIFHNYLFGAGFFSSESIGVPVLAAGISLLLYSITAKGSSKHLVIAGTLVGLSLYFRATFLPLTLLSIAVFFVIIGVIKLYEIRRLSSKAKTTKTSSEVYKSIDWITMKKGIYAFLFPLTLVALPWSLLVFFVVNPGNISWSANEYLWFQKWTSSEDLIAGGGGFQVEGGLNWPCVIDPTFCSAIQSTIEMGGKAEAQIARDAAFETISSNFGTFLSMRAENIAEAFSSLPGSPIGYDQGIEPFIGYAAFICLYGALVVRLTHASIIDKLKVHLVFFVSVVVVFANFAVLALYTIETRYFFPGHIVTLLAAGFFATVLVEVKQNRIMLKE